MSTKKGKVVKSYKSTKKNTYANINPYNRFFNVKSRPEEKDLNKLTKSLYPDYGIGNLTPQQLTDLRDAWKERKRKKKQQLSSTRTGSTYSNLNDIDDQHATDMINALTEAIDNPQQNNIKPQHFLSFLRGIVGVSMSSEGIIDRDNYGDIRLAEPKSIFTLTDYGKDKLITRAKEFYNNRVDESNPEDAAIIEYGISAIQDIANGKYTNYYALDITMNEIKNQ